ncbi:chromosomal replication initiator protein DnaA [Mycoplasmoides alvi]|uniref:chromosomal replication initiator protein DnaA n=1 Tax=Mycoplasmoides alvi TaxID=78580 RepID=UPI000698BB5B|nr:chromosomal replication initiator protein DnaA [Mycoplasmoides alvi]
MPSNDYLNEEWIKVLKKIEPLIENSNFFELHIKKLSVSFFDGENLFVTVNSDFVRNTLFENYLDKFNEIASSVFGKNINVKFLEEKEINLFIEKNQLKNFFDKNNYFLDFKKNMTFYNFVVDDSNSSAYNAVKMLSINAPYKCSPLFIYGETGLGKTHLANALCNDYLNNFPNSKIIYLSSDDFTRKVIEFLNSKKIEDLKQHFKEADLLVMEDIQFLTKRDKTNEIFFNIFNYLVNKEKIILITSDKTPDQLYDFEPRMISRFASGLTICIKKPEIKTIIEILHLKLKELNVSFRLTDQAVTKIVNLFNYDIRRLEGIINRIIFFVVTKYKNISVIDNKQIDEILESEYNIINKELNKDPQILLEKICRNYNIKKDDVLSISRKADHTNVRKICMYVFYKNLHMSLSEIGRFFNRDHSTVKTSIESIEKIIKNDLTLKSFLENIAVK